MLSEFIVDLEGYSADFTPVMSIKSWRVTVDIEEKDKL
jgi:hypothetical protein